MAEPITDAEIAELAELEKRATPGPWTVSPGFTDVGYCALEVVRPGCPEVIEIGFPHDETNLADAALIVTMRNALPRLLARIASQQEKLEAYDHNYTVAFSQNEQMRGRIAELQGENFKLAAGQCLHTIHGDERGNSYCPRIRELEAQLSAAREALRDLAFLIFTALRVWNDGKVEQVGMHLRGMDDRARAFLADSGEGKRP